MGDKLLIRAYDVSVGDCIYCRIPGAKAVRGGTEDFHVLIDCGSLGRANYLDAAIEDLKTLLPNAGRGKKRIDLLVATHEHKDHIIGLDPARFEDIKIEHIWMNAAMQPDHPQAGRTHRLHALAAAAMQQLQSLNMSLGPELQALAGQFDLSMREAAVALRETLPARNGIEPDYVHAGQTSEDLGLSLKDTTIHVLGPENDVDHFYLGEAADESLRGLEAVEAGLAARATAEGGSYPANISLSDFRTLQSRMASAALAFAELSEKVTNNTSVVLLIEWKGKRLLFVGDAEWLSRFKDGINNGSWNVMWHERRDLLDAPIDFLKIGHHGSVNATPWQEQGGRARTEPGTILDAILPLPAGRAKPKAVAVVSTRRERFETIPCSPLLVEIGKRVRNVRNYKRELEDRGLSPSELPKFELEKDHIDVLQPQRTDWEFFLSGKNYVDIEIEA